VKRALDLLGCPPDAKLLVVHADDLGMCHSVNAATFKALDEQAITSASVMVPCPWFSEVAEYATRNAGRDLGIHLTLTSEWKQYRWRPLIGVESGASLVDGTGHFLPRAPAAGWKLEEARSELSAQLEHARRAGLVPTHIDSHMLSVFGNADLTKAYFDLGRQIGIPFFVSSPLIPGLEHLITDADIVVDNVFSLRPGLPEREWTEYYLRVLRSLKPGLNLLIVHLGYDDPELQAVMSGHAFWGAGWRQRDYDAVMSEEFRSAIKENNIQLMGWNQLNSLRQLSASGSER
jgi:predicted glycoside hydrolase/deacetylase ChbG (UPF0249 family)